MTKLLLDQRKERLKNVHFIIICKYMQKQINQTSAKTKVLCGTGSKLKCFLPVTNNSESTIYSTAFDDRSSF